MGLIDDVRSLRAQWPMARRYRYRWDLLVLTFSAAFERWWSCEIRSRHRQKFGTAGQCVRCGRRLTA